MKMKTNQLNESRSMQDCATWLMTNQDFSAGTTLRSRIPSRSVMPPLSLVLFVDARGVSTCLDRVCWYSCRVRIRVAVGDRWLAEVATNAASASRLDWARASASIVKLRK